MTLDGAFTERVLEHLLWPRRRRVGRCILTSHLCATPCRVDAVYESIPHSYTGPVSVTPQHKLGGADGTLLLLGGCVAAAHNT